MNPNQPWINNMLNDPTNQMPGSSSNPGNNPGSSSTPGYFPTFQTPFMNPEDLYQFSQWKLQQQQHPYQFTQTQPLPSQPNSDHASFHLVDEDEDEEKSESSEEPIPTPTSKKSRAKSMAKKPKSKAKKNKDKEVDEDVVPSKPPRTFWSQDEEYLLAECYIQISEDAKTGADQQKDTFWYKVLDAYNKEAKTQGFPTRTKNMLTGKWTPMNKDIKKFNSVVDEMAVLSGEGDKDFMNRCHILFKRSTGYEFRHLTAWGFLKDKHKWKNPDSTLARRNRLRPSPQQEPEHFGPDDLPRPDGMYRVSKSQRSSNSTASSGSNPALFQEMLQQQYELDRKAKMDVLERESQARVSMYESQRMAEEMRVLQIDTSTMDPMNARIVRAQQARIRAKYLNVDEDENNNNN